MFFAENHILSRFVKIQMINRVQGGGSTERKILRKERRESFLIYKKVLYLHPLRNKELSQSRLV